MSDQLGLCPVAGGDEEQRLLLHHQARVLHVQLLVPSSALAQTDRVKSSLVHNHLDLFTKLANALLIQNVQSVKGYLTFLLLYDLFC